MWENQSKRLERTWSNWVIRLEFDGPVVVGPRINLRRYSESLLIFFLLYINFLRLNSNLKKKKLFNLQLGWKMTEAIKKLGPLHLPKQQMSYARQLARPDIA